MLFDSHFWALLSLDKHNVVFQGPGLLKILVLLEYTLLAVSTVLKIPTHCVLLRGSSRLIEAKNGESQDYDEQDASEES
jgi:hypothetical protein